MKTRLSSAQLPHFFADMLRLRSQKSHQAHSPAHHKISSYTLQIYSRNNTNHSISLFLFLVLPVNRKITSNPIIQTTSRQELRQQFLFQPLRSTARSQDTFLSIRCMFSERQRLILGLRRKASEIITLVDVREQ